ncbi:MAG: SDR family NAD(P)-dependent oxidoreductase, partial [Dehalococcoidia bacterium]
MQKFAGKVAVVTGAASGMGRAFAERFAREGMKVVLADIEAPALDVAVQELRRHEYDVIGVRTDTSSAESVRNLAREALATYGTVHLLCNNAGVEGYLEGPIWEATPQDWQWTFGVNFWGVVHGVQTFLPIMLSQNEEGHIVNTASATGLVLASNMYGITKHAVVALSEVLYAQLSQINAKVGVSVLCPGVVNTRIFEGQRNRPETLRNEADPQHEATGAEARGRLTELARMAMPPADVTEIVLEAIKAGRFYVLTDHEWDERIRTRVDAILQRGNPNL